MKIVKEHITLSYSNRLFEIGEATVLPSKFNIQSYYNTDEPIVFTFEVNTHTYAIYIDNSHEKNNYNISFSEYNEKEETVNLDKSSNYNEQYKVLATVIDVVKYFIYYVVKRDPDSILTFATASEFENDTRRLNFYLQYITKHLKSISTSAKITFGQVENHNEDKDDAIFVHDLFKSPFSSSFDREMKNDKYESLNLEVWKFAAKIWKWKILSNKTLDIKSSFSEYSYISHELPNGWSINKWYGELNIEGYYTDSLNKSNIPREIYGNLIIRDFDFDSIKNVLPDYIEKDLILRRCDVKENESQIRKFCKVGGNIEIN